MIRRRRTRSLAFLQAEWIVLTVAPGYETTSCKDGVKVAFNRRLTHWLPGPMGFTLQQRTEAHRHHTPPGGLPIIKQDKTRHNECNVENYSNNYVDVQTNSRALRSVHTECGRAERTLPDARVVWTSSFSMSSITTDARVVLAAHYFFGRCCISRGNRRVLKPINPEPNYLHSSNFQGLTINRIQIGLRAVHLWQWRKFFIPCQCQLFSAMMWGKLDAKCLILWHHFP